VFNRGRRQGQWLARPFNRSLKLRSKVRIVDGNVLALDKSGVLQTLLNPQPLCCGETQSLAPLTAGARAASGHATTALLKSLVNSRRLMASPAPRTKSGIKRLSHFWIEICAVRRTQAGPQPCPLWVNIGAPPTNVRFTPKADVGTQSRDIRFVP